MSTHHPLRSTLQGAWTYRSFINLVPSAKSLEDILFGEGDMRLDVNADGVFVDSTLSFGEQYPMNLQGRVDAGTAGGPPAIVLTGYGVVGTQTAGWVYAYQGFLAPTWPYGVEQRVAVVGTVIRVVPHGSGQAGLVASFVAVKH